MSGLTVLQLDGGARGSVQIVSCGCLLSQVVQVSAPEGEAGLSLLFKKVLTLMVGRCF